MPLCKYRVPFLSLLTQGFPLPSYTTYFTGSTFASAKSFLPWVRYTSPACFVRRRSSSGWCSLLSLFRPGSTIFLTSNVHFSACFGLNHFYQSSLYRLNPNLPPTITLLYLAIVFPLPSSHSEWQLHPSSVHPLAYNVALLPLTCHASILEQISAFRYFDSFPALYIACSVLPWYLAILVFLSLCS